MNTIRPPLTKDDVFTINKDALNEYRTLIHIMGGNVFFEYCKIIVPFFSLDRNYFKHNIKTPFFQNAINALKLQVLSANNPEGFNEIQGIIESQSALIPYNLQNEETQHFLFDNFHYTMDLSTLNNYFVIISNKHHSKSIASIPKYIFMCKKNTRKTD